MKQLYQPVFEYVNSENSQHFTYNSSIVYETEERARLCALDAWRDIVSEDDILIDITFKILFIG